MDQQPTSARLTGAGADPVCVSAPASLPTMELRRQLGRVNEVYLGLNDFVILTAWATQPEPIRACQILGNLIDQIDVVTIRLADLRRHAELLWDLSHEEGASAGTPAPATRRDP
jgi:hypothetical protein